VAVVSLAGLWDVEAVMGGHRVLNGADLVLEPGEVVGLVGRNGAGKTSALRALLGLLPVAQGVAQLQGEDVRRLSSRQRAERAGYLPQERRIAWNMPAVEVVALSTPFLPGPESRRRALGALRDVNADHLADRGVGDMSGGERARVLIARAVSAPGPALFLDEPIAGLDPDAQHFVLAHLRSQAESGRGVMMSLHDLTLAARYSDRVAVMRDGLVISDGEPLAALAPDILREAFGIEAGWMEGPAGPLLATRHRHQGA
jgi:iron complex transport system ATP-binding protein